MILKSFALLLGCTVATCMESVHVYRDNNNNYYCISHAGIIATDEFRWEPQSQ